MAKKLDQIKLEDIINMDSTIEQYEMPFRVMSEDKKENKELLIKFFKAFCFNETKSGKKLGALYKNGCLQEDINFHNSKYSEYFQHSKVVAYSNILQLDFTDDSQKFYQGSYNVNFNEMFGDENLQKMTEVELCAYVMQWANRATKHLDKMVDSLYDEKEKKRYAKSYTEIAATGQEISSEYCMNYQYFKDMKEEDIKEELDEKEFEEYKKVRRAIRSTLSKKEFSDIDYENLIQYATLVNCKNKLYKIKDSMISHLVYRIESKDNSKVNHYMLKDQNSDYGSTNYDCIYGVTIEGYSEPFEVHVCTNSARNNCFNDFIALAEQRIASEKGIKTKIEIPFIYTDTVKSGLPFKLDYDHRRKIDKISPYLSGDMARKIAERAIDINEIYKNKTNQCYTLNGIEEKGITK